MREHYYTGHKDARDKKESDGDDDMAGDRNFASPISVMSQRLLIERD